MAPPLSVARPSVNAIPLIVTLPASVIEKIRVASLPSKVVDVLPLPLIIRFLLIVIAEVNVMALPFVEVLNRIVPPASESMTACLKEPAPLSLVFVTVMLCAWAPNPSSEQKTITLFKKVVVFFIILKIISC